VKQRLLLVLLLVSSLLAGPRTFPRVLVADLHGRRIPMQRVLAGKPTLVNFWATFCVPCRKEMPELYRLDTTYARYGFQVVGITIDDARTLPRVRLILKNLGVAYPVYWDADQNLNSRFHLQLVPYSVLVDSSGTIVWEHSGYVPGDEQTMEREIRKLLGLPTSAEEQK